MAGGGYIKLYRSVRGTAIADNPEYFAAWIHLLLMATHTEHDQVVGRQVVKLMPGQLVFGRDKFSTTTGLSVNKVRAALKVMEKLNMITIKSTTKYSVISITKWLSYQPQSPTDDQQIASKRPTDGHKQEGINKGLKKEQDIPAPAKPDASDAFERFWKAGMRKLDKKKAFGIFKRICGDDPFSFADMLAKDVEKRIAGGQMGFDQLHPSTYLNGNRWEDELPAARHDIQSTNRKTLSDMANEDIFNEHSRPGNGSHDQATESDISRMASGYAQRR